MQSFHRELAVCEGPDGGQSTIDLRSRDDSWNLIFDTAWIAYIQRKML